MVITVVRLDGFYLKWGYAAMLRGARGGGLDEGCGVF